MTRFTLLAALIFLPMITKAQTTAPDPCGAAGFQGLVDQRAQIAEMLVLAQPMRVITPGTIVTRDYRLERINFDIDDAGQIARVSCG